MSKRVYLFSEGDASMRDLLGGKGANLSEMSKMGLPVPPGFTITTDTCGEYYESGAQLPAGLMDEVKQGIAALEKELGRTFGDPSNPLLVSVRSGAKFSMPGMMDTILNLGLNRETLAGLAEGGNDRFAWDSMRRFAMMFGDVVLGVSKEKAEHILAAIKKKRGVTLDTELSADDLKEAAEKSLALIKEETGQDFPMDAWEQLELAIESVFRSWQNERAKVYRRRERIPDEIGTAVNVQAMVYGNLGDDCGTGVAFTRDPSTGERGLYGEFLMNAQGEDVVAGVRTPVPISELEKQNPMIYKEFTDICDVLEDRYRDMQDIEFTIERNRLFMLQCRSGKRTGPAAVKTAVDMVNEGMIDKDTAIKRVTGDNLDQLLHPRLDPAAIQSQGAEAVAKGLNASPGAAVGKAVFDADTAERLGGEGEAVILVSEETTPDDVHGMLAAKGILTSRGGKTSHAAVVARGFGIPCVAGCESISINSSERSFSVNGTTVKEGDVISLDGSSGDVFAQELPTIDPEIGAEFAELMSWCDERRRLKVRTNADNPRDSQQAIEFGAEGIGLCRTEHMFFEADRLPIMRDMILAKDDATRKAKLDQLLPMQQGDFEGIFRAMDGKPVTIRLVDPPLHEFLPSLHELIEEVATLKAKGGGAELEEKEKMLRTVEGMHEFNPMMGLRGVRLSIILPGIVQMQTRAIMQAACTLKKDGVDVQPEIMIPLVSHVNELRIVQEQLEQVAKDVQAEAGIEVPYMFGTMIEIPRAALTANEIAEYAEFFSFGTNDLTQMCFGYSRDDAEGKFLQQYVDRKVLPTNPFESIDPHGVGELMRIAVEKGRGQRDGLKCGICGEHGGDPESIYLCHELGLDYVSCSPFRVPIARLAAAQAAISG